MLSKVLIAVLFSVVGDSVRSFWAGVHRVHGRQGHGEASAECLQDAAAGRGMILYTAILYPSFEKPLGLGLLPSRTGRTLHS